MSHGLKVLYKLCCSSVLLKMTQKRPKLRRTTRDALALRRIASLFGTSTLDYLRCFLVAALSSTAIWAHLGTT